VGQPLRSRTFVEPRVPLDGGSTFAAEANDAAAVAFGGSAEGRGGEVESGFAFLGKFSPGIAAGIGLLVECLGDCGWSAHITQGEDFDFEVSALIFYRERVADADFTGGAGSLLIRLNAAEFTGFCSEGAGLEEARRPEPFVETHKYRVRVSEEAGSGKPGSG